MPRPARLTDAYDAALHEAVQLQFIKLFDVLMVDPSEEGYRRFQRGLDKTEMVYKHVCDMLVQGGSLDGTA